MNKIISKEQFSEKVFKLEIEAPLIAKSRRAGHFVIVRVDEKGERMPLTIAGSDLNKGTITLVVQTVGLSSTKLCNLNPGDYVLDIVGPLGQATHIQNYGTVVCAGGGVGVAPMLPIIEALKAAGNRVISVLAGRSKDLIILENYRKIGLGRKLVEKCIAKLPCGNWSARTTPENYDFYLKCGFSMPEVTNATMEYNGFRMSRKDRG